MKDTFYSTKRYVGKYIPIYTFESYGDTVNYFIKLQYICNRDDYQNIRTAKGTSLDFDMKNEDGDAIFGDIASEHLELLKSRNYTLEAEAIPEELSEDDRLVEINEIYVYEPVDEFLNYASEIVPIWGIEDDTESATTSIVFDGSAVYRNTSNHTELKFDSTAGFKTGDVVTITWNAYWWLLIHDGYGEEQWLKPICTLSPNDLYEIYAIDGDMVEFTEYMSNIGDIPDLPSAGEIYLGSEIYATAKTISSTYFFNGTLNGVSVGTGLYMYAESGAVNKEYGSRSFNRRLSLIRDTVSYHKEIPDIPERFAPMNEVGTESTIINRASTMSPTEWKTKVANGDWFIYTEPELRYDSTLGLYCLKIKETKCV